MLTGLATRASSVIKPSRERNTCFADRCCYRLVQFATVLEKGDGINGRSLRRHRNSKKGIEYAWPAARLERDGRDGATEIKASLMHVHVTLDTLV